MKKNKKHQFVLTVKTFGTRRGARRAVLVAFATRHPDGCVFILHARGPGARK